MPGKWLLNHHRAPTRGPRLLVLFHYAGGAASAFRDWPAHVGERAETLTVQLPGREGRLGEALVEELAAVTEPLVTAIAQAAHGRPVILYGHSMGAALAHHVAREAVARRAFALAALAVSARRAPHVPPYEQDLRTLDDAGVLSALRVFGEIPAELLAESHLADALVQRTRADFCIAQGCHWPVPPRTSLRLAVPLLALGGVDDPTVAIGHLRSWQAFTRGPFQVRMLPGHHFFIRDPRNVKHTVDAMFAHAAASAGDSVPGVSNPSL
ncbi:Gramicidin S biosynthesis protein GrsT [Corallococcus coralloides]|uniref:Gramicidin S biosynthesis protein GrsT n=1 Tax=Corallococcus coralloides TaxID=184914 RepID=A0A410RQ07_CORCK|nr:alpha/beta fold hydrolase [Corallococcus coralloides]QAT84047.1 Gramicidin S biosynthesis protein GrsT [Corallococcus coralloides]